MFAYGDPFGKLVEFDFEKNQACTRQAPRKQAVGFYNGELVFGAKVPGSRLIFDLEWKLLAGPFHSCKLIGGPGNAIFYKVDSHKAPYCFPVDIYFLPYDQETNLIIPPILPGDVQQNVPVRDHNATSRGRER